MELLTDTDLYDRAVAGDRDAVELVVRRYHQQLTAYGRAWGWDDQIVQDGLQVMWMKFFQLVRSAEQGNGAGLHDPTKLLSWLATTLRNSLRDEHRSNRRQEALGVRAVSMASTTVIDPDLLKDVEVSEKRLRLKGAFSRLGQTCRELLGLLLIDPPMSYGEIADVMEKPVGSIGPTRQRCIETMKSILAEES